MSIIATNYPDPSDPTTPVPAAVAWVREIHPDFGFASYYLTIWVNRSAGAANAPVRSVDPVDRFTISQGDVLSDGSTMPTIAAAVAAAFALQKANAALDPMSALKGALYPYLMKHPKFAGLNPVQGS